MPKKDPYNIRLIDTLYGHVPAFTDIFDEETWYVFAVCVVLVTILAAYIASRYVTIRPVEL